MTEETTAAQSISALDLLPTEYSAALRAIAASGLAFEGSGRVTVKDGQGDDMTVYSYNGLNVSADGLVVEELNINIRGFVLMKDVLGKIFQASLPEHIRENLAAEAAATKAA